MSNIKALDALRRAVKKGKAVAFPSGEAYYDAIDECMDAIEREVAERFMELPVDSEGVPIHYGDSLSYCGEHGGTVTCKVSNMEYRERSYGEADWLVNVAGWVFPGDAHHVKPRTLEDVLASYRFDARNIYEDPMLNGNQRVDELEALDGKVAAEIRELMGVSE